MINFFSIYPKILLTWAAAMTKMGWGVGRKTHYSHQTEPAMAKGEPGMEKGF